MRFGLLVAGGILLGGGASIGFTWWLTERVLDWLFSEDPR